MPNNTKSTLTETLFFLIPRVHVDYFWPNVLGFFFLDQAVGENDDPFAPPTEPGSRTAQGDLPWFTKNGVGLKAVAVMEIQDMDLFSDDQAGGLEEGGIDGDAPLVIEQRIGDRRHMDLGFQHLDQHVDINYN